MGKKLIAYTDGSYNSTTGYYGCGTVLIAEDAAHKVNVDREISDNTRKISKY